MKTNKIKPSLLVIFTWLLVSACGLLAPQGTETDPGALYTQAAQTVSVQLTERAVNTLVAQLTQPAGGNSTPTAGVNSTPLATPTAAIASPTPALPTPSPTLPPPTFTPAPPTPTPDLRPCDAARFVSDVTVPDGTSFAPGGEFSKVWRLENVGTCTWTSSYSLEFVSGDRLRGTRVVPLYKSVAPGERIDLSVDLIAPAENGRYRGFWMLSNARGDRFGIGEQANGAFWVDIRVLAANHNFAYDLAVNMCTATWRSSAGSLLCPSNTKSEDGSIDLLTNPVLEGGRHENESTLWTRPETVRNGWISGVYPPYTVKANDHFLAEVGCLNDNKDCALTFSLSYQVAGGTAKSLGEWFEIYDGNVTLIDVDLSSLTGKTVQFILTVTNNGKVSAGSGFWLVPSVRQVKPPDETPAAVKAAAVQVAQSLGTEAGEVSVVSWQAVTWTDACLGIKQTDENCAPASIPGYKVILQSSGRRFEAHTNQDGSLVYWFELA